MAVQLVVHKVVQRLHPWRLQRNHPECVRNCFKCLAELHYAVQGRLRRRCYSQSENVYYLHTREVRSTRRHGLQQLPHGKVPERIR